MTKYFITAEVYDKKGNLLSSGVNSYTKTHPLQKKYAILSNNPHKEYLHAEIAALVKCRGEPYKIVVKRVDKKGNTKLARPCSICQMAIKEAGVKIVEYTLD